MDQLIKKCWPYYCCFKNAMCLLGRRVDHLSLFIV